MGARAKRIMLEIAGIKKRLKDANEAYMAAYAEGDASDSGSVDTAITLLNTVKGELRSKEEELETVLRLGENTEDRIGIGTAFHLTLIEDSAKIPMGIFSLATSVDELNNFVSIDSPLGSYMLRTNLTKDTENEVVIQSEDNKIRYLVRLISRDSSEYPKNTNNTYAETAKELYKKYMGGEDVRHFYQD